MDGDDDLVAEPGERLVDRVVDHLEHHVVQPRAVGGVADVHARALAHRLQALQDLDGIGTVLVGLGFVDFGFFLFRQAQILIGMTTYLKSFSEA